MAYVALYRKYRSQNFEELMGQDQVTTTLQNALRTGRIAHAYLFHGARGCGKTSTARLLSRALNCVAQDGPSPTPCGVCRMCVSIREGTCMDVVEIDAASETGVDNVREKIIENVQYASSEARYKVYIIDEVHDLSAKAFDALLKTLEEPPPHVIFILATTEYQKVPITIRSRCQGYQFKRGSIHDLSAAVERVVMAEGFTAEPEAIQAVARSAEGSWRDALSILEQVLAYSDGLVTAATVHRALGTVGTEMLARVTQTLARGAWNETLDIAADLVDSGTDVRQLLTALGGHLRDLLLLASGAKQAAAQELGPDRLSLLQNQATLFAPRTLLDMMGELSTAERELRFSNQHRVILERVLCRLMMLGQGASAESQPQALGTRPRAQETSSSITRPAAQTSSTQTNSPQTPSLQTNSSQTHSSAANSDTNSSQYSTSHSNISPTAPSVVPRPPTQQAAQEFATSANTPAASFAADEAENEDETSETDLEEAELEATELAAEKMNALDVEIQIPNSASSQTLQNQPIQNGSDSPAFNTPRNGSNGNGTPPSSSGSDLGKHQFADEVTLEVVQRAWPRIVKLVEKQSPSGASYLQKGAIFGMEGKTILLSFKEVFARDRIQNKGKELVEKKINEGLKTEGYRIQCLLEGQTGSGGTPVIAPKGPPSNGSGGGIVPEMATLLDSPQSVKPPSGPSRVMDFEIHSPPPPMPDNETRPSILNNASANNFTTSASVNNSSTTNASESNSSANSNSFQKSAQGLNREADQDSNKGMLKDVLDIFGGQVINTEPI